MSKGKILGARIEGVTSLRIVGKERNNNYYYYDIRACDDDFGMPATIEKRVAVNHLGTLITLDPIDLGKEGFIELNEQEQEKLLSII